MDTLTKDSLLSLINQSLSGREISNILNCSWTKIRYFAYKNNIDLSTVEYNKKYNVLTKENYDEIVDLYNNQAISLTKIADMYHMDRKQLSRDLKERGIVIRKDGKKPIDSHFFDNIDTKEKAYWLGFLYADGYVQTNNRKNVLEIGLQERDSEHLYKFRSAIKSKHSISVKTVNLLNAPNNELTVHKEVKISFHDTQICNKLIEHGCVPNKRFILSFPNDIFIDLMSHFIRGHFDGDGCIYKVNETNRYCISIVSALKNFVDDYYNFFKNNLNIIFLIESKKTKNGHLYSLRLNKQSEVKKFLSYIYNNSTEDIRLTRKYEKAKNLL